jgi:hypothetical protein
MWEQVLRHHGSGLAMVVPTGQAAWNVDIIFGVCVLDIGVCTNVDKTVEYFRMLRPVDNPA